MSVDAVAGAQVLADVLHKLANAPAWLTLAMCHHRTRSPPGPYFGGSQRTAAGWPGSQDPGEPVSYLHERLGFRYPADFMFWRMPALLRSSFL